MITSQRVTKMKIPFTPLAYLLLSTGFAFAGSPKIAKDLEQRDPASTVDVIVQFARIPTETHHKKVTDRGGQLKTALGIVKGGHYSIQAGKLADLANDPEVLYISPDRKVRGALDYAASTVGADLAYKNGWDGSGVAVAVIDSGLTDHWDLRVGSDNPNNEKALAGFQITQRR